MLCKGVMNKVLFLSLLISSPESEIRFNTCYVFVCFFNKCNSSLCQFCSIVDVSTVSTVFVIIFQEDSIVFENKM